MILTRFVNGKSGLTAILLLSFLTAKTQNKKTENHPSLFSNSETAEAVDAQYASGYDSFHIMEGVAKTTGASKEDMNLFCTFYSILISNDRQAFIDKAERNNYTTSDLEQYAAVKEEEYVKMYRNFLRIKREFPTTVAEYTSAHPQALPPLTCNPSCTNIDFESGNLSGWYAYCATNNSTVAAISYTTLLGGVCGAVTKAAIDTATNKYKSDTCLYCLPYKKDTTYQVTITHGTGNDPIAGLNIPIVAPGGGNYSCRIGDSSVGGSRVGILEQAFVVSASNDNFTYKYAVLIDQATHHGWEQPYLSITLVDQTTNDTLPCGVYIITSAGSAPKGFDSVRYRIPSYGWTDYIYYRPWTTVFVPLQHYIGHCLSIQVRVSDCYPSNIGPHFCYAYFDASCGPFPSITASPSCSATEDTLYAPIGGARYLWTGPCISGVDTDQTALVTCSGTYTVDITSPDGCSDTIQSVITFQPPLSISDTIVNAGCNIKGSATVRTSGGASPFTYHWSNGSTSAKDSELNAGTYTCTITQSNGCISTISASITQPNILTVTISAITNISCYNGTDGSASVNVSGGQSPYTYSWSPSGQTNSTATGLSAGTYTVTITDANGCSSTISAVSTQPPALSVNAGTVVNVSCFNENNGSADANVSGGTGPYTYSWSPSGQTNASANGLSAGTYTLTVRDANGCISTITTTITQPAILSANISATANVLCNGGNNGSSSLAVTGGTGPYKYSWTPAGQTNSTATGLSAGTYTIIVTDNNGCTSSTTSVINQPSKLVATSNGARGVCSGNTDTINVLASGGIPVYTYSWNNGITENTPGPLIVNGSPTPYICTITDSCGDIVKDTINVTEQPEPIIIACCNTTINSGNDTIIVASGKTIKTYKGEPQVTCLNPPCDSVKVTPTVTTAYTVTGTDSLGCEDERVVTIIVETPCLASLQIPNVFTPDNAGTSGLNNVFYIKTPGVTVWSIIIYDRWGKEMYKSANPNQYWDGNTESGGKAPDGVYYYLISATCQDTNYKKDGFLQLIR